MPRLVTLTVRENSMLYRRPTDRLAEALAASGYAVEDLDGLWSCVSKDVTVTIDPGETADSLEWKFRTAFLSDYVRILLEHDNEPLDSEGVDVLDGDGRPADLTSIIEDSLEEDATPEKQGGLT